MINTDPKVDHEIFRRSARTTKAVNLYGFHRRGGIRF